MAKVAIFTHKPYLQLRNTLHKNGVVSAHTAVMLATDKKSNSPGINKQHHFYHQSPKRFITAASNMTQHMAPVKAKE